MLLGTSDDGDEQETAARRGAFQLPCFDKATSIILYLGFIGLAVPPAGVFSLLTLLFLDHVRFEGPWEIGDAVSSPRCPCLQKLSICNTLGLHSFTIHSESLLHLELRRTRGLRQLTVVTPSLKVLSVISCFVIGREQPVATIAAPQLVSLEWRDTYDESSVQLGKMHLKAVKTLTLTLAYVREINNFEYLMEDMTMLPDLTVLCLVVIANGHAFGSSSFHVLKMCTGIRNLVMTFSRPTNFETQTACSSECICYHPLDWKTEELILNRLQYIEIRQLRGSEHEVAFMKQLFCWATVLKQTTVTFDYSVNESKAKELFQMLKSFSRPGTCMKFYINQGFRRVLYAPEG